MPISIINLTGETGGADWLVALNATLVWAAALFAIYIGLIVFCVFLHSYCFQPEELPKICVEMVVIPGIRPGQPTADYLDYITRLTFRRSLSSAVYSSEILISNYAIPFYFGNILVVVTVTLIQSRRFSRI